MDTQPNITPPVAHEPATAQEPQANMPAMPIASTKNPQKSRRTLWVIVALVIVAIAVVSVAVYTASQSGKNTQDATKTQAATDTHPTGNPSVNSLTSTLTHGADNESSMTTDDSSTANSINQSASNVGDSVDESKF